MQTLPGTVSECSRLEILMTEFGCETPRLETFNLASDFAVHLALRIQDKKLAYNSYKAIQHAYASRPLGKKYTCQPDNVLFKTLQYDM